VDPVPAAEARRVRARRGFTAMHVVEGWQEVPSSTSSRSPPRVLPTQPDRVALRVERPHPRLGVQPLGADVKVSSRCWTSTSRCRRSS